MGVRIGLDGSDELMTEQSVKMNYHICQNLDALEAKLDKGVKITWLMKGDRVATESEIRDAIRRARAKGYEVLPPCDNVDAKGHCKGHVSQRNDLSRWAEGLEPGDEQ